MNSIPRVREVAAKRCFAEVSTFLRMCANVQIFWRERIIRPAPFDGVIHCNVLRANATPEERYYIISDITVTGRFGIFFQFLVCVTLSAIMLLDDLFANGWQTLRSSEQPKACWTVCCEHIRMNSVCFVCIFWLSRWLRTGCGVT